MKSIFALLVTALVFGLSIAHISWGDVDFSLVGTDPDDLGGSANIDQVFVASDAEKIYFKITSHRNWAEDISFGTYIDVDQNSSTGSGSGSEYSAYLYLDDGILYGGLYAYNATEGKFLLTEMGLHDASFRSNSNSMQLSVLLSDIGNPDAFDFGITMWLGDLMDVVPDAGFYTYQTTGQQSQSAVQKAMEWLATQQESDGDFTGGYALGTAATAVLAFEEKGHLPDSGKQYSSVVEKALDFIFTKAVIEDISIQDGGNPDTDGDGKGVYFNNDHDCYAYETGLCLSAILASEAPNRRVTTGDCAGWTYSQVVRDVIDYMAFAQDDDNGGWKYSPNSGSDNSAAQWPVFGMIYAEQWGIAVPGWVRSELSQWVNYVQNPDNGGSGYGGPNDNVNIGKTGGILIEMYWLGDSINTARAQKALSYINNESNWNNDNKGNAYAVFSVYKGLRLMGVESLTSAVDGGDWYSDYVDWLVDNQNPDGYWDDQHGACLATGWYILVLEDVVPSGGFSTATPQPSSGTLPADGTSTANINVTLTDPDGKPLTGQTVIMTVTSGSGTMGGVTDNGDGSYTSVYTAGNTPGTVIITITYPDGSTTTQITLVQPGAEPSDISVESAPGALPADGVSTSNITVTIKDSDGNPVIGQIVIMVIISGQGTLGTVTDNGDGSYSAKYTTPDQTGKTTISVTAGGVTNTVSITLVPTGTQLNSFPEFPGHSYTVVGEGMTWSEAEAYAESLNGHLVTISSDLENRLITDMAVSEDASDFWIGLTDEVTEGIFVWVTGEPVTYTNWYEGEPNDYGAGEDSTQIGFSSVYSWNDQSGDTKFASVVEFDAFTPDGGTTSATDTMDLFISEVTGWPGETVVVPINITDATNLAGADLTITYDSSILTINEANPTQFLSNNGINLVVNTNTPGRILLRMAGTNAMTGGSGTLVEMTFAISANATVGTETPVKFGDAEAFNVDAANIPVTTQDGKVKIAAQCMKGDVSNDGKIKSNDAILALRIAAELIDPTAQQFCAADMNSDNKVKSNDAILILRTSAGLLAPDIGNVVAGDIAIMLSQVYGEAGGSITVPLRVDNALMLAGGDISIVYDRAVLRAVDVSCESDTLIAGNVSKPGIVRIAFAKADGLVGETVANLKFDVVSDHISPLTIQDVELYGLDALPLESVAILDGKFTSYLAKPKYSMLLQNYPNPFNPDTWIPYGLSESQEVTIWILSDKGEIVRKLDIGRKAPGLYVTPGRAAYWDGKNEQGEEVSSGVYFYSIRAGEFSGVKKMVIKK